jgi:hypothetical protein
MSNPLEYQGGTVLERAVEYEEVIRKRIEYAGLSGMTVEYERLS